jgi:hypothetical protein
LENEQILNYIQQSINSGASIILSMGNFNQETYEKAKKEANNVFGEMTETENLYEGLTVKCLQSEKANLYFNVWQV